MTSLASVLLSGSSSVLRTGSLKADSVEMASHLKRKDCVLLYFSAHWCPPCRNFTPKLATLYRRLKQQQAELSAQGQPVMDFEIIFVSCDRTETEFEDYYRSMPWAAIPYSALGRIKDQLSAECCVQGIPSLVILNKDLEIIAKDGVHWVTGRDPMGRQFHSGGWFSGNRSIYDLLNLGSGKGGTNSAGALAVDNTSGGGGLPCFTITNKKTGKVYRTPEDLKQLDTIAFYFSAAWCPPCKQFTPKLAATYRSLVSKGTKCEIIFVSWDKNPTEWKNYYDSSMPWATFDYTTDTKLMQGLATRCSVNSIPTLVTVNAKTGTVINLKARDVATNDPEGKLFPWAEKHNTGGGIIGSVFSVCCRLLVVVIVIWLLVRWL